MTIRMGPVGDPGNKSVGVIQTFGGPKGQFVDPPKGTGIYATCDDAPAAPPPCVTVGAVDYEYGIGEYEVTVDQYVTFLNTADADGRNLRQLYLDNMSPTVWAQYGSISYSSGADRGKHSSVAYPERANKPFNFGDFRRGARFANPLTNGDAPLEEDMSRRVASPTTSTRCGSRRRPRRACTTWRTDADANCGTKGFVVPSNDEWIKAAYYDPKGGGTQSYWAYPTGPFDQPNVSVLDPKTGNVTNADKQPLATYNPNDPNSERGHVRCATRSRPYLVSVGGGAAGMQDRHPLQPPAHVGIRVREDVPGEREHGRPGEDSLPVGHARHGRERVEFLTDSPRSRRDTTSCASGATTTAVSRTRRRTRWRSRPSATSRRIRISRGSIPARLSPRRHRRRQVGHRDQTGVGTPCSAQ